MAVNYTMIMSIAEKKEKSADYGDTGCEYDEEFSS